MSELDANRRGAALPRARAGEHRRAGRGVRGDRGRGGPRRSTCSRPRSPGAASSCGGSPAASRSPPTPTPTMPRAACSPSPRTPPLTQAQAETLAIVAYLQPVSRPEIARIRGVASESAVADADRAGPDRGGGPVALRSGHLPHDAALRAPLRSLGARPAPRPGALRPDARGRAQSFASASCEAGEQRSA